jgi:RNA polymerase sigma factor (sigma-70 family)
MLKTKKQSSLEARLFPPDGLPRYSGKGSGLSRDDEKLWFRRLCYARIRAKQFPESIWAERWQQCRQFICSANLGLIFSSIFAFSIQRDDPRFDECESVGHEALLRAVDYFSLKRKCKLSTLAVTFIRRDLIRILQIEDRQSHFEPTDPQCDFFAGQAAGENHSHDAIDLKAALATLDDRERLVIEARFFARKTLKEVGKILGRTKERTRQIEKTALKKLRDAMQNDH